MISVFDISIVVSVLAFCVFLGLFFRTSSNSSSSTSYFLAQRNMYAIPAALSITVSILSSTALTIFLGEIFIYGCSFTFAFLSSLTAATFIVVFVVHCFYDSPYISAYQFLEHRFSRPVRITNSAIFIVSGLINSSVVGYSASISVETLVGVPFWVSALITGLLSTAYSALGGIRAVIWTDVCQGVLMLLFISLVIVKGSLSFQNFEEFWTRISDGHRIQLRFLDGSNERCSIFSVFSFCLIITAYVLSVSQYGIQRWKSVSSIADAKKTVKWAAFFIALFFSMLHICGLILYGFYSPCTKLDGPLPHLDKVSLYFVLRELSAWPGVLGLCLAGVLSGGLSTLSSYVNSLAAVTLEDFIKTRFTSINEKQQITLAKILTVVYGLVITAMIFGTAQSNTVIVVSIIFVSISMGPPLGTFVLAIFSKRANTFGVNTGLIAGVVVVSWLSVGSFLVGNVHEPMHSGNLTCSENTTSVMRSLEDIIWNKIENQKEYTTNSFLLQLYQISFYWYSLIGCGTSAVLGYFISICYERFRVFGKHRKSEQNETIETLECSKDLLKRKPSTQNLKVQDELIS